MYNLYKQQSSRLISIDAFRALIMVLMIFVNDLWTLKDIPRWLDHVSAETDGMGLADIVFPAFLFIVGLSVPYAIDGRKRKGDDTARIFIHILSRTVALLVMGLFLVNAESYGEHALLRKPFWMLLLILAFFLIWTAYKEPRSLRVRIQKAAGIALLILLAFLYGTDTSSGFDAMGIHWWGILGLIGWAYFAAASVYLLSGGRFLLQVSAFLFFLLFSSAWFMGWLEPIAGIRRYVWISGDGAMPALSMAGIVTALIYKRHPPENKRSWLYLAAFALLLIIAGFVTRPLWGISKIRATPSWVAICAGISISCFLIIAYITDLRKKIAWYDLIRPGGTSTLTCYLIPYVHYAVLGFFWVQLPVLLRTGTIGLGKSLIYALLIVFVTGWLEKVNIRLRI